MNYKVERRYHLDKMCDFCAAFEPPATDVHIAEKKRVLFRVGGRPFDALAWIDELYDLVCITTRTAEMPTPGLDDAVTTMHQIMQVCWEHWVAFTLVDKAYELSMAIKATQSSQHTCMI